MLGRDFGLDVIATAHIMESYRDIKEWDCPCEACEYMRKEPRLVAAILKSLKKDKEINKV